MVWGGDEAGVPMGLSVFGYLFLVVLEANHKDSHNLILMVSATSPWPI